MPDVITCLLTVILGWALATFPRRRAVRWIGGVLIVAAFVGSVTGMPW